MKLPRRDFLKTTLTASAATALSAAGLQAATPAAAGREYYELRAYKLKPGASTAALDGYLEKALFPALAQRGIKDVGAFTELEIVDRAAGTSKPKADSALLVLIPHPSLESFVSVSAEINNDPAVQKAGADYLQLDKANAAFERIDSWLLVAFKGMPQHAVPAFSRSQVPTRVFELRTYESYSEAKALAKIAMFHDGEIEIMKDLGMNPVFFGQGLSGPNLPHLSYITSGPDLASHLGNWKKFGPDPRWAKIKDLPQYKDTVSKNTSRFLSPRPYSPI